MKESFYFDHDYDAHRDPKIIRLRREMGWEGYGLFWCIVEMLASSSEARLTLESIDDIAFELHSECDRITRIVREFELFNADEKYFWSERLLQHFREREARSEAAKKAAKTRWASHKKKNATAMQPHCEPNAIKQRKTKQTKTKQNKNEELDFSKINEELLPLFLKFAENRITIKKPLTQNGIDIYEKKLNSKPLDEVKDAIENSIANNWQGIFFKDEKKGGLKNLPQFEPNA